MATDGLALLAQTDLMTGIPAVGVAVYLAVKEIASRRKNGNGRKSHSCDAWTPEKVVAVMKMASHVKDSHEILTEKSDGRPLVYHERGTKAAIAEMHKDIVREIRSLTAAVKQNGT